MLKRIGLVSLALVLAASVARAQDTPARPVDADAPREQPRHTLRVLEHPYDIASFYRSSQSSDERYFSYQSPYDFSDRYPIAAHYRNRQSRRVHGFAPYWTGGSRRARGIVGYRRSLGSNADLFLIAPTFLAPVGPLTSAFFGER
jgi:hypothetical protein